jgi:hypothetical protein
MIGWIRVKPSQKSWEGGMTKAGPETMGFVMYVVLVRRYLLFIKPDMTF